MCLFYKQYILLDTLSTYYLLLILQIKKLSLQCMRHYGICITYNHYHVNVVDEFVEKQLLIPTVSNEEERQFWKR